MTAGSEPSLGTLSAPAPLTTSCDVNGFDCGEPFLNDWLKQRALQNESRFSRSYAVCDESRVVAYYSLSAGAVQRSDVPGKIRRNAPEPVPVTVIGRLAVDRAYAGRRLGASLLSDALRRIAGASQIIGIAAVMVQAKNERARGFYLACAKFIEFPAESRTLYLSIETVIAAFG